MEKIQINTVPVTIRVMEVGGKKMTLSVFNQIQRLGFFNEDIDISEDERKEMFLGWVSYKGSKFVIFVFDGCLKKDEYTYAIPNVSIKISLRKEKERLVGYIRIYGENDRLTISQKLKVEALEKEWNNESVWAAEENRMYGELCTPESQIFIAI